jgi:hypothetical protein
MTKTIPSLQMIRGIWQDCTMGGKPLLAPMVASTTGNGTRVVQRRRPWGQSGVQALLP